MIFVDECTAGRREEGCGQLPEDVPRLPHPLAQGHRQLPQHQGTRYIKLFFTNNHAILPLFDNRST